MKVVIILPTYNEKGNIGPLIREIEEIISGLTNYSFAILVVDDSSPDDTASVVEKFKKKYPNIFLISNNQKVGLGRAMIIGMDYAVKNLKADLFLEMDADLSHDPKKIPQFLKKIEEGADFVVGSRYIKGGSIPKRWGIHRKIFSLVGNLTVRTILGIFWVHEWTSGFRAIKKEFFLKAKGKLANISGYTYQVVFLHQSIKNGAKIAEVPINFSERYYGRSKLVPKEYITNLLKYLITARFLELWQGGFLKYCLIGTISFIISAVSLEVFYFLGFNPGVAAALGTEIAVVFNFLCNNFWTFSHKKISGFFPTLIKFIQFNFTSLGAVVIQGITVGIGTYFFGDSLRVIILAFSTVFLIIPYNWFMYSRVIWKKNAKKT